MHMAPNVYSFSLITLSGDHVTSQAVLKET